MSAASKNKPKPMPEVRNAKAGRDYIIGDRYEAGIVLKGTEIKAVREGKANISDAYIRFDKGAPVLCHAHIAEYTFGTCNNHSPYSVRRLLLHTREIHKILGETRSGGYTVIPLRLYFKGSLLKCELAVCIGKNKGDRRETLKLRDDEREMRRAMSPRLR
jgi:SsrA-binding protein